MIDVSWQIQDDEPDAELTGTPRPLLGTWHYLRNSLRREWRLLVALAVAGAAVGLAMVVALPPSSKGTVTILMAHPANLDGPSAMSTDVSLLNTREVALRTVRKLGLDMTPEAFQSTIGAEPVTTEILTITVSGPDDSSAVTRADALTAVYLDFRASQLRSLSSGLISGYQSRISAMQKQVTALNRQYAQLTAQGASAQNEATDILTRRSQLNQQIYDMQQATADAALGTDAAVSSTHVIDAGRAVQYSRKRTAVLAFASGGIAGIALGGGYILFRALTSDRVRRRQDVATAMGVPVRFSVASEVGRVRLGRFTPSRMTRRGARRRDLEVLTHGLESALLPQGTTPGLDLDAPLRSPGGAASRPADGTALVAVGNARVAAEVIVALAARLAGQGRSAFLVDLSSSGALVDQASALRAHVHSKRPNPLVAAAEGPSGVRSAPKLRVFRPAGVPALARGPRQDAAGVGSDLSDEEWRDRWSAADVVLVLAEVDPGIEAENLRSWVSQVVPLVTAGMSSPELLETTADLVRAAGLSMPFAMMVGAEQTDESLGAVDVPEAGPAGLVSEL